MMLQSEGSLYLIILIMLFLWVHVFSQHGFYVTRTNIKDELKPDNCSAAHRTYSTKNCHTFSKDCPGSCICLNGSTLLMNQKNELQCEGNFAKDNVCHYALQGELTKKKLVIASNIDLRHEEEYVGKILLRNRNPLKNCIIHGDKSTFWNITQWSPLFTDNRKSSDIYFAHGFDILALKEGSHMEEAYKGLLINLTIQCEDKDGNPHPKSCVMFKVSGERKYTVGSNTDTRTKITTTEAPPSELEGSVVISIGIAAPIVLILLIAVAVYCNKRRKKPRKQVICGVVPPKPPKRFKNTPPSQSNEQDIVGASLVNPMSIKKEPSLMEDSDSTESVHSDHDYLAVWEINTPDDELTIPHDDNDIKSIVESTSVSISENEVLSKKKLEFGSHTVCKNDEEKYNSTICNLDKEFGDCSQGENNNKCEEQKQYHTGLESQNIEVPLTNVM